LPALLRAVAEQGYTQPTPIQAQAIPVVLAGRDLLGAAQTGTGKTAGFTLPLLQKLVEKANTSHSPARHPVRALIITPTRKLAASFMRNPATVEVARRNTPAELVAQVAYPVQADQKRSLLAHLVQSNDWRQVLVFVRTKHGANRLAQQLLREGIEADAIHGNKAQNARTRTLAQFKAGSLRVLVATDIAARGLDIEALPHVVNYDMPHVAEDYVHRIGRTGRAGVEGEAVSLVSPEERPLLAAIEKLMNRKVEQRVVSGFHVTGPRHAPAHRPHSRPADQPA